MASASIELGNFTLQLRGNPTAVVSGMPSLSNPFPRRHPPCAISHFPRRRGWRADLGCAFRSRSRPPHRRRLHAARRLRRPPASARYLWPVLLNASREARPEGRLIHRAANSPPPRWPRAHSRARRRSTRSTRATPPTSSSRASTRCPWRRSLRACPPPPPTLSHNPLATPHLPRKRCHYDDSKSDSGQVPVKALLVGDATASAIDDLVD